MKVEDIRRVLIVGAGTMGQQIGFQCAMHGYDVVLYDIAPDVFERAKNRLKSLCERFISSGRMTREQSEKTIARITATTSPSEAARGIDILSESVPEDLELKSRVLSQFNKLCRKSLPPSISMMSGPPTWWISCRIRALPGKQWN